MISLRVFMVLTIWCVAFYSFILVPLIHAIKRMHNIITGKGHLNLELKIYLDDERECPAGWVAVRNYQSCIEILEAFKPTHLSLDHDLGEEKTGYDVVKWIEKKCFNDSNYHPPIMTIHSANPAGRQNMDRGIKSIQNILSNR